MVHVKGLMVLDLQIHLLSYIDALADIGQNELAIASFEVDQFLYFQIFSVMNVKLSLVPG